MNKFWNFLKYNNTVPIALGFIFLSTGAAMAASPEVREAAAAAVLSQQSEIISVDNTYLVNKDLDTYSPKVVIDAVTEDDTTYFVSFTFTTIGLEEHVWKDIAKKQTIVMPKAALGEYQDLGVYVTAQLRQIIGSELAYLREAQEKERKQVSLAVMTTTYGGLIGKFLDASTETLPGYTPVVVAPVEVSGPGGSPGTQPAQGGGGVVAGASTSNTGGGNSTMVSIQVLGNNPARVPLRASYVDLGAVLLDPYNTNVGLHTYVDGVETVSPNIDTSTTTSYAIEYRATDLKGGVAIARRIVLVGDAADPGGEISSSGTVSAPPPPAAPAPEPEPAPTPPVPSPVEGEPVVEPTPTPQPEPTPPAATSTPPVEPAPLVPSEVEGEPEVLGEATSTPPIPDPTPSEQATSTPVVE